MEENQENPAASTPVNSQNPPIEPTVVPSPEFNQQSKRNKKLPFVIIAALILFSVLVLAILNWRVFIPKGENIGITPVPTKTQSSTYPAPKIEFKNFVDSTISKPSVREAQKYITSTKYQQADVENLANYLSVPQLVKKTGGYYVFSDSLDNNRSTGLIFNENNGNVFYISIKGEPINLSSAGIEADISSFLASKGLWDETLSITASYKRKDEPNMTFYEVHRDWGKVGLPILNPIGLLNTPENVKLSDLSLTYRTENMMPDSNIILTSDNKDGLARQTDFNTMTVLVSDKNQKVYMINSNIRKIAKTDSNQNLISYEDAINKLRNGKTDYFYTSPTGNGVPDWSKIYIDNKAVSENAYITETLVTFLEKPGVLPQGSIDPYYVFRGYSDLKSGYRVNFYAAVKATGGISPVSRIVGNVYAQEDTIQLKTFTPTPTPSPTTRPTATPRPTNPPVTQPPNNYTPPPAGPTPTPYTPKKCTPAEEELNPLVTLSGLGVIGHWYSMSGPNFNGGWYFIQNKNGPNPSAREVVAVFLPMFESGQLERYPGEAFQSVGVVESQWSNTKNGCPLRITNGSPTIFVYGNPGDKLSIGLKNLIYLDPPVKNKNLSVRLLDTKGRLLINDSFERNYIYYEYDKSKISFNKPDKGWIIEKDKISQFVKDRISSVLKLTEAEENRTIFEIRHAATDINSQYVFIGLIDQNEINSKLPLEINPAPKNLSRFHFFVGQASNKDRPNPPALTPADRSSGSLIIEIGSYSQQ
ncbi:MAG: hypothetical protein M1524_00555 [Patescibacteria group bacterium]|nr:hypothetical protein [Patescibacteria group bacterium]